jgi:hypothetical protein
MEERRWQLLVAERGPRLIRVRVGRRVRVRIR